MINNIQNNFIFRSVPTNNSLGLFVPESVLRQGLMSDTAEALYCFVGHGFSYKLQAYMLNYAASITSFYPLYG